MSLSPEWLRRLASEFGSRHYQLYVVGGAVRDYLLHQPITEWDCATDARPTEIEAIFRALKAERIGTIGARFGTVTAVFNGETVEVTTFRGEEYQNDSRQPTVQFSQTLEEDLSRRDFTINAIAWDILQERLIDRFNGQADLEQKIVRTVGQADERFNEDPLRMLRAVRFATCLGLTIEPETLKAISVSKDRLAIISTERITSEISKLLLAPKPSQGIQLLVETGLIAYILPELLPSIDIEFDPSEHKDIYAHILQVLDQTPAKLELRWCALLHDIAKPLTRQKIEGQYHFLGHENVGGKMARAILNRLKYPNQFTNYVTKLVRLHQRIPNYDGSWSDGGVRRFVRDAGETLKDLFVFARADTTGTNPKKLARYEESRQELENRITKLEQEAEIAKIKGPLDGQELMDLFHRPAGAWIKPVKEKLLQLVLDGELKETDKEKAVEIARRLMNEKSS